MSSFFFSSRRLFQDSSRHSTFGSNVWIVSFYIIDSSHTGGNLVFHHRDHSFDFNTSSILESAPSTSVAYVAFYSDVQHEVLEVTSGARITITYNLYYDSFRLPPPVLRPRIPIPENHFTNWFREAYRDAAFIRNASISISVLNINIREPIVTTFILASSTSKGWMLISFMLFKTQCRVLRCAISINPTLTPGGRHSICYCRDLLKGEP